MPRQPRGITLTVHRLHVNHSAHMVNEGMSPRALILARLREAEGPVSGQDLADQARLSRVAVHKQARAMETYGYRLRADRRGYILECDGDYLYPWEFPGIEERVEHWRALGSTMDRALALGTEKPGRGWLVIAESQAAGRGRRQRAWESRPGGIFASLCLTGRENEAGVDGTALCARARVAAGLAVCMALREEAGIEAGLQWPNDVYAGGRKLGGILVEMSGEPECPRLIVLGLGINVRNRPPRGATSLKALGARVPPRRIILASVLRRFTSLYSQGRNLEAAWNALFLGRGMVVVSRDGLRLGRAIGIDGHGDILVEGGRGSAYPPWQALIEGKGGME